MVFDRNLLFQGFIFRFHVSFRGCSSPERIAFAKSPLSSSSLTPWSASFLDQGFTKSIPFRSSQTTNNQRPTTNDQQPTTNKQQTTTNNNNQQQQQEQELGYSLFSEKGSIFSPRTPLVKSMRSTSPRSVRGWVGWRSHSRGGKKNYWMIPPQHGGFGMI